MGRKRVYKSSKVLKKLLSKKLKKIKKNKRKSRFGLKLLPRWIDENIPGSEANREYIQEKNSKRRVKDRNRQQRKDDIMNSYYKQLKKQ
jgi:hypothetical protein